MRRFLILAALLGFLAIPSSAQQVQAESFMLDNGMEFFLVPREEEPNAISLGWLARVGSVNEAPGYTGLSHYFEHMMFKGTSTIGTSDSAKDAELSSKLSALKEEIFQIQADVQIPRWRRGEIGDPWDPQFDTPEIAELRKQIKQLQEEQREITVKDEFDKVYTNLGASGMNAFTSYDLTFFIITVPSNKFELWAWMESDRLSDSVFREFVSERDVVHEERRLRTESTPTGLAEEQFDAMFWQSSPYSWPVIGWPSDIYNYTLEKADRYWNTYYKANNLVGVVVGDFDPEEVKPIITKYFGRLEPSETPPPPVVTVEMPQQAEKRMVATLECQPQVEIRYHTVPHDHADSYPLDMMGQILNGRTGRLYKNLVEGREIASEAFAYQEGRKYGGAFSARIVAKGDAVPEDLEQAWYEELEKLQKEPVGERELQKVKNQVLADSYRRLQSNFFLMIQIGLYEAMGGWEYLNENADKLLAVTPDDIMRVAGEYFDANNRAVALYHRKEGTAPEDPALQAIPAEMRGMVKQQAKQIEMETDLDGLKQGLQQMEAQKSQVPPQMKPVFDYLLGKVQERIAELEAQAQE